MKINKNIWRIFGGLFLFFLFLLLPTTLVKAISSSDIDFYYTFDDNCDDNSENGYDLTASNLTYSTEHFFGNSAYFNASENASSQNIGCSGIFENTTGMYLGGENSEFSISLWFKRDSDDGASIEGTLLGLGRTGGTEFNNYKIVYTSAKTIYFTFHDGSGSSVWMNFQTSALSNVNSENNLIVVGKIGSLSTTFKMFLNGEELSLTSATGGGGSVDMLPDNTTNMRFAIGNAPVSGYYGFKGRMAEIVKFNKILSSDEIADIQENTIASLLSGGGGGDSFVATIPNSMVFARNNSVNGWSIPVYYDVCAEYKDISRATIYVCEYDEDKETCMYDEAFPSLEIKGGYNLSPCSRFTYIQGQVFDYTSSGLPYQAKNKLRLVLNYHDEEKDSVELYSGVFETYVYEVGPNASNYLESGVVSPLMLPLGSSPSLSFNYDLSGYEWSASSSEVCLFNLGSNKKINNSCVSLSAEKGFGMIPLDAPPSHYQLNLTFIYLENGKVTLTAPNSFSVVWGEGLAWFEGFHDSDDEDDEAGKISAFFRNSMSGFVDKILKLFPFNLIKTIATSWNSSATGTLPPSLSFLKIADQSGNIKIALPAKFSASSSPIVVFGPAIFAQSPEMASFFAGVRSFSTYLLIFLFFMALFRFGKRLYLEIRE